VEAGRQKRSRWNVSVETKAHTRGNLAGGTNKETGSTSWELPGRGRRGGGMVLTSPRGLRGFRRRTLSSEMGFRPRPVNRYVMESNGELLSSWWKALSGVAAEREGEKLDPPENCAQSSFAVENRGGTPDLWRDLCFTKFSDGNGAGGEVAQGPVCGGKSVLFCDALSRRISGKIASVNGDVILHTGENPVLR